MVSNYHLEIKLLKLVRRRGEEQLQFYLNFTFLYIELPTFEMFFTSSNSALCHRAFPAVCYALPGGHVVDALRDDIAAALDLQKDGRRVGELVPVRQGGEAARTHHPVQLSLNGK
jgi:hypothetical protein